MGVCCDGCEDVCVVLLLRFSGLKAEDFASVTTTLSEVQHELLSLVAADTILVGHSLESDLRALKVSVTMATVTALSPLTITRMCIPINTCVVVAVLLT